MHAWLHGLNWVWIAFTLAVFLVALVGLAFLAMDEALRNRTDPRHRAHPVH